MILMKHHTWQLDEEFSELEKIFINCTPFELGKHILKYGTSVNRFFHTH